MERSSANPAAVVRGVVTKRSSHHHHHPLRHTNPSPRTETTSTTPLTPSHRSDPHPHYHPSHGGRPCQGTGLCGTAGAAVTPPSPNFTQQSDRRGEAGRDSPLPHPASTKPLQKAGEEEGWWGWARARGLDDGEEMSRPSLHFQRHSAYYYHHHPHHYHDGIFPLGDKGPHLSALHTTGGNHASPLSSETCSISHDISHGNRSSPSPHEASGGNGDRSKGKRSQISSQTHSRSLSSSSLSPASCCVPQSQISRKGGLTCNRSTLIQSERALGQVSTRGDRPGQRNIHSHIPVYQGKDGSRTGDESGDMSGVGEGTKRLSWGHHPINNGNEDGGLSSADSPHSGGEVGVNGDLGLSRGGGIIPSLVVEGSSRGGSKRSGVVALAEDGVSAVANHAPARTVTGAEGRGEEDHVFSCTALSPRDTTPLPSTPRAADQGCGYDRCVLCGGFPSEWSGHYRQCSVCGVSPLESDLSHVSTSSVTGQSQKTTTGVHRGPFVTRSERRAALDTDCTDTDFTTTTTTTRLSTPFKPGVVQGRDRAAATLSTQLSALSSGPPDPDIVSDRTVSSTLVLTRTPAVCVSPTPVKRDVCSTRSGPHDVTRNGHSGQHGVERARVQEFSRDSNLVLDNQSATSGVLYTHHRFGLGEGKCSNWQDYEENQPSPGLPTDRGEEAAGNHSPRGTFPNRPNVSVNHPLTAVGNPNGHIPLPDTSTVTSFASPRHGLTERDRTDVTARADEDGEENVRGQQQQKQQREAKEGVGGGVTTQGANLSANRCWDSLPGPRRQHTSLCDCNVCQTTACTSPANNSHTQPCSDDGSVSNKEFILSRRKDTTSEPNFLNDKSEPDFFNDKSEPDFFNDTTTTSDNNRLQTESVSQTTGRSNAILLRAAKRVKGANSNPTQNESSIECGDNVSRITPPVTRGGKKKRKTKLPRRTKVFPSRATFEKDFVASQLLTFVHTNTQGGDTISWRTPPRPDLHHDDLRSEHSRLKNPNVAEPVTPPEDGGGGRGGVGERGRKQDRDLDNSSHPQSLQTCRGSNRRSTTVSGRGGHSGVDSATSGVAVAVAVAVVASSADVIVTGQGGGPRGEVKNVNVVVVVVSCGCCFGVSGLER
ncbi:hypothetical protein ACOMHN_028921 [Nucella lapillus]